MVDQAAAAPVKRRRRRWPFVVLAALLVALAGLFVLRNHIARWFVEREARAAGIVITIGTVDIDWGTVALGDVQFTLAGAPQLRGRVNRAVITRTGLAPERVDLRGVGIEIEGAPGPVIRDLLAWTRAHDDARALRIEASDLRVRWAGVGAGAADPGGFVVAGSGRWSGSSGVLRATQVTLAGRDLGAITISWSVQYDELTVGIDSEDPESAPLQIKALPIAKGGEAPGAGGQRTSEEGVHVEATLKPLPLGRLLRAGVLSTSRSVPGAQRADKDIVIDGSARFVLPTTSAPRPIEGTAALNLAGYVPPHPVELDGILFGDRTTVTTRFTLEADRDSAKLTDFVVSAGSLKMTGQGTITRAAAAGGALDHAVLDLRLSGAVACSILTRSAGLAHLGKLGGDLLGDLAKRALTGSVAVTVLVAADTRDLAAARISPSARVGCKLRLL